MITVITPTTGKQSLFNAISSLKNQQSVIPIRHILLWDNKREGDFLFPNANGAFQDPLELQCQDISYSSTCIVIKDDFIKGAAAGSALRAVGLMAANTEWVTFMDDDVMWDSNHLDSIMNAAEDRNWAFCKRRIWTPSDDEFECLGIDEFESVGERAKTSYKMVDNNSMVFKREYGVSAACLYRNTKDYNDDRLMYGFLKKFAGDPGKSNEATINQICPDRLIKHFRDNCTIEEN
jgi:hypothetical protein